MNSTNLRGTPIPEKWTLNLGANLRPMEVGMEIRDSRTKESWFIVAVSDCAAQQAKKATAIYGETISVWSELEYRRAEGVVQTAARRVVSRAIPFIQFVDPIALIVSWPGRRIAPTTSRAVQWVDFVRFDKIDKHNDRHNDR